MPDKQKTAHLQRVTTDSPTAQFDEEAEEVETQTAATTTYGLSNTELRRAIANPHGASPQAILGIQTRYGNQAVQRMLAKTSSSQVQRGIFDTLKYKIKAANSSQTNRETMDGRDEDEIVEILIKDMIGHKIFRNYCVMEFSDENIDAFDFILKYDKAGRPFKMAQEFQRRYIGKEAAKEINLPSKQTNAFLKGMSEKDPGEALANRDSGIRAGLMVNLLDTFARFKTTDFYQDWLNKPYVRSGTASAI